MLKPTYRQSTFNIQTYIVHSVGPTTAVKAQLIGEHRTLGTVMWAQTLDTAQIAQHAGHNTVGTGQSLGSTILPQ